MCRRWGWNQSWESSPSLAQHICLQRVHHLCVLGWHWLDNDGYIWCVLEFVLQASYWESLNLSSLTYWPIVIQDFSKKSQGNLLLRSLPKIHLYPYIKRVKISSPGWFWTRDPPASHLLQQALPLPVCTTIAVSREEVEKVGERISGGRRSCGQDVFMREK